MWGSCKGQGTRRRPYNVATNGGEGRKGSPDGDVAKAGGEGWEQQGYHEIEGPRAESQEPRAESREGQNNRESKHDLVV